MASELHTLIEEELKNKNYKSSGNDEEKALMGALRVEARVKEHQHQKKILTVKRSICVGGGLLVVIVLWAVLALKSKSATKSDTATPPLQVPHHEVSVQLPGPPPFGDYSYDDPDYYQVKEATNSYNVAAHEAGESNKSGTGTDSADTGNPDEDKDSEAKSKDESGA